MYPPADGLKALGVVVPMVGSSLLFAAEAHA
jgi:hypothetical protein